MLEFLQQPWPWYVSGPMLAFVMISLLISGGEFGVSSTLRAMCSFSGAGKKVMFFNYDWKSQIWNIVFIVGAILGGFIASYYLTPEGYQITIAPETAQDLQGLGLEPAKGMLPESLFNIDQLFTLKGFVVMIVGGFLIGFGARYAGGCTSGHAISGLSNLQFPSLIAVLGFFIGGLIMTFILLPYIVSL